MNSIPYKAYKDIMNRPHILGVYDCYTVIRDVLNNAYGILIPNYARPEGFYSDELDLFSKIAAEDYWEHLPHITPNDFQAGDVLSMKIQHHNVNHVAIYLGNNLFLHQLHDRRPQEENLSPAWLRKIYKVSRHKDIDYVKPKYNVLDLMPNYKKVAGYVEK